MTKPKSPSFTDLAPKDLLEILNACARTGIRKLDWNGLKLEFDAPHLQEATMVPATEAPELAKRRHAHLEAEIRQQQLDELMAMDPEKYEELIAQGELLSPEDTDADEAN